MRIAVTGASGNVGSALLRRLDAGEHEVVGLARRPPEADGGSRVRWVAVDLTEPAAVPALREAFAGVDAVVHLAWGFQPSHDEGYLEELGVGGTRRVLEAVTAAEVPHLVHMSSVGAYSPKRDDERVDESWPTEGVPSSMYSRHKSAAERLLDDHERRHPQRVVTRMRPGIVGQRSAGSALLRYGVPAAVPARLVRLLPLLPVDRRLAIPVVHADDVADAFVRALEGRAPGPFNLAAEPPVTAQDVARALRAKLVHLPSGAVRAAVSASWRAHLQPVDPGWVDLAYAVPLLDTTRAREQLGWSPSRSSLEVLEETVEGMADAAAGGTPVLRPRTVGAGLARMLRRGPVAHRRRP